MSLVKPSVTLLANAAIVIARGPARAPAAGTPAAARPCRSRVGKHALRAADFVQQVGMRQLAALGPAGGARGVDQRRRIGSSAGRRAGASSSAASAPAPASASSSSAVGPSRRCATPCAARAARRAARSTICGVRVGLGERQHRARSPRSTQRTCSAERRLVDRHGDARRPTGSRSRGSPTRSGSPTGSRPGHRPARPAAIKPSAAERIWAADLRARHVGPDAVDQALEDHVVRDRRARGSRPS